MEAAGEAHYLVVIIFLRFSTLNRGAVQYGRYEAMVGFE